MKRIILTLVLLTLALGSQAQELPAQDSLQGPTAEDTVSQNHINVKLGISAGATLFNNGNDLSPYYSKHGFFLQIPLRLHWEFAPQWELATGLRYDFNWDPLYYNVEMTDDGGLVQRGITASATQHAYHFSSYVGIPASITFYPFAKNHNALGLSLDVFAGLAVANYIHINDHTFSSQSRPEESSYSYEIYDIGGPVTLGKIEVGLTVSTSLLGLAHGMRLYFNLLPTYQDPTTGEKIYTSGISLFL